MIITPAKTKVCSLLCFNFPDINLVLILEIVVRIIDFTV